MSEGCVSGRLHALAATHLQTWTSALAPALSSSRRTDPRVTALRTWSTRPTERRRFVNQKLLGATGVSLAAAALRRRSTCCPSTRRKAVSSRAAATDHWFQSQLEALQLYQPFDPALSERGVAAVADVASPAKKQEPWRYTDLDALLYAESAAIDAPSDEALRAALDQMLEEKQDGTSRLVFIDGTLSPDFSFNQCENGFLGGAKALRLQSADMRDRVNELLQPLPEVDMFKSNARDALGCAKLAALNQALFKDCACLCIPADDRLDGQAALTKAEVVFVSTGSSPSICSPRILINVGRNQRLHVVESHLSLDPCDVLLTNSVCRVLVGEGADVKHDLFQQKAGGARFLGSLTAEVASDAAYDLRVVQSGSRAARLNVAVSLKGSAASCEVSATMMASDKQQLDLHSLIHHSVPGCKSKQQHKNVVADQAECIFKGSIAVEKEAQQTKSEQLCRSLLLSKRAKVKAMPSLKIQADDVTCSHGAAVTELDQGDLFYMASRGLGSSEAKKLLLTAFPQDLLAGMKASSPKAYGRVLAKLKSLADLQEGSEVTHVVH